MRVNKCIKRFIYVKFMNCLFLISSIYEEKMSLICVSSSIYFFVTFSGNSKSTDLIFLTEICIVKSEKLIIE